MSAHEHPATDVGRPTTADLRAIARAPYAGPQAGRLIAPGLVLTRGDADDPEGHLALAFGPLSPDDVLAAAAAAFDGAAYAVALEPDLAGPTEERLRADGWSLDEEEPALVLTPLPPVPAPPDELAIHIVATAPEYEAFFGVVGDRVRRWVPTLAAATAPDVALFVGSVAGEPVATARLTCHGAVGEITSVTVAPSWRRRGYGTALTWAAIAEGARRGCTAMTLTASDLGEPVYRRMGFVPVCTYRTYLPPGWS